MTTSFAYKNPIFRNAGEGGLIVEFGTSLDEKVNNAVIVFEAALRELTLKGIIETMPTIKSVLIRFNPLILSPSSLRENLLKIIESRNWLEADPPKGRTLWHIPVLYGKDFGPDLAEFADLMGMSEDAAIKSHSNGRQRIYMIGFAPGQAYLGLLGPEWDIPRLPRVNPGVPAGSIMAAVRQTCIYATPNPTGWRVIGRTPFRGFVPESKVPFKLSAGDEVLFVPITVSDYKRLEYRAGNGTCVAVKESLP